MKLKAIFEGDLRFKGLRHVASEKTVSGYRYLWGETQLRGEAAALQNELRRNGFKDAYVVHYFNGERISVAEAVAIRNGNIKEKEAVISAVVVPEENEQLQELSEEEKETLEFRVQIAASKVKMELTDTRLMGMNGIEEYRHEGLFKYSLGSFRSFGEANQFKNVLRAQGLTDAFVVPFQKGNRLERGQVKGIVHLQDAGLKGIGGISVMLFNSSGEPISTILSEADGSFLTPNLEPGIYRASLIKEELNEIGMKAENLEVTFKIQNASPTQYPRIEFLIQASDAAVSVSPTGEDDGLVFKVQVLASVPKLPVDHTLLKGLEEVERYRHQGLYKYTVGESKELEEIRTVRNQVRLHGFEDAFIVAFLNVERINLQEMTGKIFVRAGREEQGLEGINIEVLDTKGRQVTNLVSNADGKFSFLGLKPGVYTARLDSLQLEKLGLRTDETSLKFEIQRNTEGMIREPLIFKLQKINNPYTQSEEENNEIEYRIQLAASNVPLGPNHPTMKGMRNVSMYRHNGMYKYTTSSTYSLREARELMNNLGASHDFTLFIVGFKEGKRVFVVE